MKEIAQKYFNFTFEDNGISASVASFFDAALVYCHALYSVLQENKTIENMGVQISKKTQNLTIDGIGGPVIINSNGDRLEEYSILSMDHETQQYKPVMVYNAKSDEFNKIATVRWPGGCDNLIYTQMMAKLGSKFNINVVKFRYSF